MSHLQLVGFTLEGQGYAVPLSQVERIVHVVEWAPLPQAPEIVLGVINFSGRIIPVADMRRRFRLPAREPEIYDFLIIARTSRREIAFTAETLAGVIDCPEEDLIAAERIVPGLEYLQGVMRLKDGLIFIHDLDRFLSLDEEKSLETAMQGIGTQ
ncbi:MAG: chemotaxis protein CheW [Desulfobaccales bacterium]